MVRYYLLWFKMVHDGWLYLRVIDYGQVLLTLIDFDYGCLSLTLIGFD